MPEIAVNSRLSGGFCPKCGNSIFEKDGFCSHCGVNLRWSLAQDTQPFICMEPDRIVKGQAQVHKDLRGSSSEKPALVKAGYFLILTGFLLFALAVFHIPSTFWDQDFKVNWYQRGGLEIVDDKPQYTFSLIQPETGEPGFDELKTLALSKNPAFFSQSPVNELVYLRNFPEGEDFRRELFGKGYNNLGINLIAYEVIPGTRPRNGLVAAVMIVILGILLILRGRGKSSRAGTR